jgi:hypothetical protein
MREQIDALTAENRELKRELADEVSEAPNRGDEGMTMRAAMARKASKEGKAK